MLSFFTLKSHGLKAKPSLNPVSYTPLKILCYYHNTTDNNLNDNNINNGCNTPISPPPQKQHLQQQSLVRSICSLVCESYSQQTQHVRLLQSPSLNLSVNPDSLTHEQAITVVASLASEAGSMVALSFFNWAIGFPKFRYFMRFYIVCATSLIGNENFERAHEVMDCMVRVFAEIGRFKEAVNMVIEMENHGLVLTVRTLNCVTGVAGEMGLVDYAENVFDEMRVRGVCPDSVSYKLMAIAYCRMGRISDTDRWLKDMVRRGFVVDNATCTLMISTFCEKGFANKLSRAEMLLGRMKEQGLVPNTKTYTCLIDGHGKAGNFEKAYELMDLMGKEGFSANIFTYNAFIDSLCKKGRFLEACKLLKKGFQLGLQADTVTYTILISELCRRADTREALVFFSKMFKAGVQPDMHTYNTLIAAFSRQRRMEESEKLFAEAVGLGLVPTKETYTSMICGYCRDRNVSLALKFFNRMSDHGCTPDSLTYGALISGLCKESKLDEACQLYEAMVDKGLSPCEVTRLTLAYEYCKQDESATAMVILERLDKKLWIRTVNTLIRKLCSERKVGMAVLFFHKLLDKDQNVDRVTLTAFTTACYESNKYALVSDLSERISKGIEKIGEQETPDFDWPSGCNHHLYMGKAVYAACWRCNPLPSRNRAGPLL
ncbi:hypothetical protein NC651_034302 [Populus alba x Populus x berolinensis]|nr:hypothetical protein NC651_034302 [Populus alba x Populus x berolinensis]